MINVNSNRTTLLGNVDGHKQLECKGFDLMFNFVIFYKTFYSERMVVINRPIRL